MSLKNNNSAHKGELEELNEALTKLSERLGPFKKFFLPGIAGSNRLHHGKIISRLTKFLLQNEPDFII